jgi:hypothetical protein
MSFGGLHVLAKSDAIHSHRAEVLHCPATNHNFSTRNIKKENLANKEKKNKVMITNKKITLIMQIAWKLTAQSPHPSPRVRP